MAQKATYTGDRCDGMAAALVNWLTEHAEEVSYRQFAKHVDVRSFGVGPLSRCDHCTFLRTTLPSGGPAWVLQWSGFEHLAVDDPGALDVERETVSKSDPTRIGLMPLRQWLLNHHFREVSAFVSRYASTDPSENFAEMLAAFALGQLEQKAVDLLTPILADAQKQP